MILKDNLKFQDMPKVHKSGIFASTKVIGGYGLKHDTNGVSSLEEVVFTKSNMIPIGGCQYSFEQLFGVKGSIDVPSLYTVSNGTIGLPDRLVSVYESENEMTKYYIPALQGDTNNKSIIHPVGEYVCLWGCGISGSGTNVVTKIPVDYKEYSIQNSLATENGTEVSGVMIPFRHTTSALTETDAIKYFGKTTSNGTDPVDYYLKRFDTDPAIKHFWKNSSDDVDSTNQFTQNEYYPRLNTINSSTIETYVEMVLSFSEKDLVDWFDATSSVSDTRFNTIALYTGRYNATKDDYENVRLFSKLCIPVTNISLMKDFTIIYRMYSS